MKNEEPEKLNQELEVTSMDRMVMNTQNLKKQSKTEKGLKNKDQRTSN